MEETNENKVRFCWHCGHKLWGDKFTTHTNELGQKLILHKECKDIVLGKAPDHKVDIGELAEEGQTECI